MEKLRKAVGEMAYTQHHSKLSHLQLSLIPVLFFDSSLYKVALSLRRSLYHFGLLRKHRLPVSVISVGNLTWGRNGKTPMVEFIARYLADSGISALILTSLRSNFQVIVLLAASRCCWQGYAGGDDANRLHRQFLGRPIKIGVGANRAAVAARFFTKDMVILILALVTTQRDSALVRMWGVILLQKKIGTIILDDGMQVSEQNLKDIDLMLREINKSCSCFHHTFDVGNANSRKPLGDLSNTIVLCVSASGSSNAFAKGMEKIGAFYVDRLEFSDHHKFQAKDIEMIKRRLRELEDRFSSKPIVIVTEKDYYRDPGIFKHLDPFEVLALCSELKIIPNRGCSLKIASKSY